ncbi:hypothetical protein LB467_12360 [Salegentibacter sp. JZCK2]|uniref:hypothetical protein n=1 Tax=Salegentibacter tibetensis TaxID=2873600 RepID=UPI001CCD2DFD|nr:hypothetical protein [Salegentibacter tibetensis]MBZ9730479.1 hypothetical protein [Salegentibacter tibetensis]
MEDYSFINRILFVGFLLFLCGCGKNVTYIEEIDISDQVNIRDQDCNRENLYFVLEEISVWNTVQDTFLVRSHTDLRLSLQLKAINNDSEPKKIFLNDKEEVKSNFSWIINETTRTDTIHFLSSIDRTEFSVKPNDTLELNLQPYFNFYNLLGDHQDYSEPMKNLLSQFSPSYIRANKEICIEQGAKTKITISNHKSHWEWW